jgi:hypothetical protein
MMLRARCSSQEPLPFVDYALFFPAAFAFAALFLLLRIITTLKKEPTTAEPKRMRITGIRIAQTRGGKKFCRG